MASISLQFQGVRGGLLPLTLVGAIVLVLLGWGAWQLARRRVRSGLISLAAALGPGVFVPAMVLDAVVRLAGGDRRAGAASLLAAAAAGLASLAAAAVAFGAAGGLWMGLLGIEVALAVGVFYASVYAYLGRRRLAGLMVLRCLGILVLMLLLFKPALSVAKGPAGDRPYLPILVDRSGSMGTTDDVNLPDRYRQCIGALRSQRERIERHFTPVWYHFARSPKPAESLEALAALKPTGPGTDATDIAAAVRAAAGEYPRAMLAGILILSDGIDNAGSVVTDAAVEAGVPIYAVAVGSTSEKLSARRNVEIVSIDAPLEAVLNNVTKVTVRARLAGFATAPLEVRLVEEGSETPVGTQRLWTDQNVATLTAELKWTPRERPGAGEAGGQVRRLHVRIPPDPAEQTAEDNAAEIHVLVTEPRIRVLYVEGTIRPEYKFLRRLLATDPNIRFIGLVRIAGNRFSSQGEIAGRRLTKLPETDEEFALFDVIILGDLDRTFLTAGQMARIRRFVNDGGALLMLGGHNSFGPGGYGGTDIEAVLPVVVGPRAQPQETTPFIPQLTGPGEAHPIFEGFAEFFYGPGGRKPRADLPGLPQLLGCVTVVAAKPAASLLAIHPTRQVAGRPVVVLAVQRVGAGRTAAFTADTTWRWYLPLRGLGRQSPYERFWGQMLRWLANVETKSREVKPSVVMRLEKTFVRAGQGPVKLLARVQDEKGRPAEGAQVLATVTPPPGAGKAESVPLSPQMGGRLFQAELRPPKAGRYRVEVAARDASGAPLGSDSQEMLVVPYSKELDRLGRNDGLLELLAHPTDEDTGGRKVELAGLPDLLDQVIRRGSRTGDLSDAEQATIVPLYHFPLLFAAFVVLLTAEWFLRRRWNLR